MWSRPPTRICNKSNPEVSFFFLLSIDSFKVESWASESRNKMDLMRLRRGILCFLGSLFDSLLGSLLSPDWFFAGFFFGLLSRIPLLACVDVWFLLLTHFEIFEVFKFLR